MKLEVKRERRLGWIDGVSIVVLFAVIIFTFWLAAYYPNELRCGFALFFGHDIERLCPPGPDGYLVL